MISLKKTTLTILLAVTTLFTFSSFTASANTVEDTVITAEVQKRLAEERDIPKSLEVTTKEGVVSLKGEIDTSLQAGRAIEVASSVDGVTDVLDSNLKVKESKSLVSDTIITAKVKGIIRRLYVKKLIAADYDLHVETTNQVVHIMGKVSQAADIDTVINAAKEVKNVKSVKSNITN